MRSPVCLALFLLLGVPVRAGDLVINEVLSANHATVQGLKGSPDWLELYNAAPGPRDVGGMRITLGLLRYDLPMGTRIAGKGHLLIPFGAEDQGASFGLPREGATLLLVDADGTTVLDVFSYPRLSSGISFGRSPDGASSWSYFREPTPGAPSPPQAPVQGVAKRPAPSMPGGNYPDPVSVAFHPPPGHQVHYTTDGSTPVAGTAQVYTAPLRIAENTVLRMITTGPGLLQSPVHMAVYTIGSAPKGPVVHLGLDPVDLLGDSTGIDVEGAFANHTRTGRDWERDAQVLLPWTGTSVPLEVGVRVTGNGSRGRPKRSFKLLLKDRFGSPQDVFRDGPAKGTDECMLRADASPGAYLQNTFMEAVAGGQALALDVQPSIPVQLFINGEDRGLYRAMAPKDVQWITATRKVEAIDLLDGPALKALSGGRRGLLEGLEALLTGAPLDSLERWFDVASLIDLACMEVYTGRADHDLNVRCWRERSASGRWRWILYDQDLWPSAAENSVARMCSSELPEAPFLKEILRHPELRVRMLARYAALMGTLLAPDAAQAVVDSIGARSLSLLQADHARWAAELGLPTPEGDLDRMGRFVQQRPSRSLEHLAGSTGARLRDLHVTVSPAGSGTLVVEGCRTDAFHGRVFSGAAIRLKVIPAEGMEFVEWKGAEGDGPATVVVPDRNRTIKAVLRATGTSGGNGLQQSGEDRLAIGVP